jgi:hypothetical protein
MACKDVRIELMSCISWRACVFYRDVEDVIRNVRNVRTARAQVGSRVTARTRKQQASRPAQERALKRARATTARARAEQSAARASRGMGDVRAC